jgi:serine/threonine protein phosphatase PrpC
MEPFFAVSALTRHGPNELNTDTYVVQDRMVVVADGVTGGEVGEVASALAVSTIVAARPAQAPDPAIALEEALSTANRALREAAERGPGFAGMASTLDVISLDNRRGAWTVIFAHIGNGTIWIQSKKAGLRRLTEQHAAPAGPLLRAVGLAPHLAVDIRSIRVSAGDRLIIATDGLTGHIQAKALLQLFARFQGKQAVVMTKALIQAAHNAGVRDDTTVVIADVMVR